MATPLLNDIRRQSADAIHRQQIRELRTAMEIALGFCQQGRVVHAEKVLKEALRTRSGLVQK